MTFIGYLYQVFLCEVNIDCKLAGSKLDSKGFEQRDPRYCLILEVFSENKKPYFTLDSANTQDIYYLEYVGKEACSDGLHGKVVETIEV